MSDRQANDKKEKDWKDALLKSSLPLEQLVSETLESNGFTIGGEYSYVRPNEHNARTEFSIDLHTDDTVMRKSEKVEIEARLNLLVECKYCSPGVKWIFSPYAKKITGPLSVL